MQAAGSVEQVMAVDILHPLPIHLIFLLKGLCNLFIFLQKWKPLHLQGLFKGALQPLHLQGLCNLFIF